MTNMYVAYRNVFSAFQNFDLAQIINIMHCDKLNHNLNNQSRKLLMAPKSAYADQEGVYYIINLLSRSSNSTMILRGTIKRHDKERWRWTSKRLQPNKLKALWAHPFRSWWWAVNTSSMMYGFYFVLGVLGGNSKTLMTHWKFAQRLHQFVNFPSWVICWVSVLCIYENWFEIEFCKL